MRIARLTPEFVEFIPEKLEDGRLYISEEYRTAVHRCCCGCGLKVVTPLRPTDWRLTRDGLLVTLYPSVGNWSFPCRSHYWIRRNQVHWSYQMTREEIEAGRRFDAELKEEYYAEGKALDTEEFVEAPEPTNSQALPKDGFWQRLWRSLFG